MTVANVDPKTPPVAILSDQGGLYEERSALAVFWRRFSSHRMAVVGLVIMCAVALYILVGSIIFSEEYANDLNLRRKWEAPSAEHPMGTDEVGRDVLARTIYGGQISLAISVLSVMVTTFLGTALGLIAGYYGGWIDNIIMRVAEALLSIPLLFLLLVLSKFIGTQMPQVNILGREISGSVIVIILVLGLTTWMGLSRIVRSIVLSLKEREFVIAARAIGMNHRRIVFRHILPNAMAPVIVATTLGISQVILIEANVSFLGLGVQPPTASWGNMIQRAMERIDTAQWLWFFPGALILLSVLSANFIGDGLRDALDPYSTK